MRTLDSVAAVRKAVHLARDTGRRVGFVPTMGYLHEGHLRLVDRARQTCDFVVMSIFVNPLQFAPTDDLARYPRDPEGDAAKAASRGVDVLFTPSVEEMYPGGRVVRVDADGLSARWEGESRPGHFSGVLTVVSKLFNIVQPDVAVFGQKDYQQAALVRALVRDLDFPLQVIVAPTMREPDGLAMSSRNSYLSAEERERALALSRALRAVSGAFAGGESNAERLLAIAHAELASGVDVEYLALVDPATLEPVERCDPTTVALVAARVGRTRLIDNAVLGVGVGT